MRTRRTRATPLPRSAFSGFRFPPDVILLAVRWYLRFGLSYRDLEECSRAWRRLLTTSPCTDWSALYAAAGRRGPPLPSRRGLAVVRRRDLHQGRRRVALRVPRHRPERPGHRRVRLPRRDAEAARRFFQRPRPLKVHPPRSPPTPPRSPRPCTRRLPSACHHNNTMPTTDRERSQPAQAQAPTDARPQRRPNRHMVISAHAFVQNLRRGHYELAVEEPTNRRLAVAFEELILAI